MKNWSWFAIIIGVAAVFATHWVFMLVWNGTISVLFGTPTITYWQAWGIGLVMAGLGNSWRMGTGKASS